MYEQDLAVNNFQRLKCRQTEETSQSQTPGPVRKNIFLQIRFLYLSLENMPV